MRVGIVYGGTSSEAKASEKNARSIENALRTKEYDVCMIEYKPDIIAAIRREQIDIVYLCVQGKYHGDGTLQAMLDHEQIPYTGSAAHAAMLINDKILCKFLFDYYKIPTPGWKILRKEQYLRGDIADDRIHFPFVAKAPTQGGSFGIELIRTADDLPKIARVFQYDDPILLEEFIDGGFYTVGLFEKDGELLTLKCVEGVETVSGVRMEKKHDITLFTGEYAVEAPRLAQPLLQEMERLAAQIFELTGARDVARVDFMVSHKDNRIYALEINAVPGLKRESLMPGEAAYSGIRYEDMVEDILLSAYSRSRQTRRCERKDPDFGATIDRREE